MLSFSRSVLFSCLQMLAKISAAGDPVINWCMEQSTVRGHLERVCAKAGVESINSREVLRVRKGLCYAEVTERASESKSADFRSFIGEPLSNGWLQWTRNHGLSARQIIHLLKLRSGTLPTRSLFRPGSGNTGEADLEQNPALVRANKRRLCRRCGDALETPCHVAVVCRKVTPARVVRHDAVVSELLAMVRRKDANAQVYREMVVPVGGSTRENLRPDLIWVGEVDTLIIDATVPWEGSKEKLRLAEQEKVAKYQAICGVLSARFGKPASVMGIAIGARGLITTSTARRLMEKFGYSKRQLRDLSRRTALATVKVVCAFMDLPE